MKGESKVSADIVSALVAKLPSRLVAAVIVLCALVLASLTVVTIVAFVRKQPIDIAGFLKIGPPVSDSNRPLDTPRDKVPPILANAKSYDMNGAGGTDAYTEQWEITLHADGSATARSQEDSKKNHTYGGYLRNGYLSLAYVREGTGFCGIGNYLLRDVDDQRTDFIGYGQSWLCDLRKFERCPFVVSTRTFKEIDERWGRFLAQPCTEVSFSGEPATPVALEAARLDAGSRSVSISADQGKRR
jgi:hypothetical protein